MYNTKEQMIGNPDGTTTTTTIDHIAETKTVEITSGSKAENLMTSECFVNPAHVNSASFSSGKATEHTITGANRIIVENSEHEAPKGATLQFSISRT